ncbi:hypothetical protein HH308_11480 [Gordonia sp. TBRC 11910]|uniref:Uncharacterized protein n=1 Tax=Gordonia asplenii TaxID=2725283 RepID=A0A848KU83_9ACTN|nr:hypothetical protein [Gordonia asplenii]
MLTFALGWASYGGGDAEDIRMHFGVTEPTFLLGLRYLLSSPPTPGIDELTWARLRCFCERRLTAVPAPTAQGCAAR